MPFTLTMQYTAYAQVTVPNDIALKIQNGNLKSWNKWGDLYYIDGAGKEQKITGERYEGDFKRAENEEWVDEGPDATDDEGSDSTDDEGSDATDGLTVPK